MFFVQANMAANTPATSQDAMLAYFEVSDQMGRDLWVMKRHHGKKGECETPLIDRVIVAREKMVDSAKQWAYLADGELAAQLAENEKFMAQLKSVQAMKKPAAATPATQKKPAAAKAVMTATQKKPAAASQATKKAVMKAMKKATKKPAAASKAMKKA